MNLFRFSIIRKNKLLIIIALLLLSLLSVSMDHGSAEIYKSHNHECLFKQAIKNNKQANLRILLKKLRPLLLKLFRLPQILLNPIVLATIFLVLLFMHFFIVSILDLFSFLCFYFHGSKFKHSLNHSDLLPLMAG
jgi:hypothetical protein